MNIKAIKQNCVLPLKTPIKSTNEQSFTETLKSKVDNSDHYSPKVRVSGRWILETTGSNSGVIRNIIYPKASTKADPIMCLENGDYPIHINDVDPSEATELEMRMLCAHLDATGKGTGSTFGTYNELKTVRMVAQEDKYHDKAHLIPTLFELQNTRFDWLKITDKYRHVVKSTDPRQYTYVNRLYNAIKNHAHK